MRRFFASALFLTMLVSMAFAQMPKGFTYQAVIRNTYGQLMSNTVVGTRISILKDSESGPYVYSQVGQLTTNNNGLLTTVVGADSYDYDQIDWSTGPYFLLSEIDPSGGNNYTLTTIQQIMAVPIAQYATYAKNIVNGIGAESDPVFQAWGYEYDSLRNAPTNLSSFNNDLDFVSSDSLYLSLNGDTLYLSNGRSVLLKGIGHEYQQLSIIADTITLTNGGSVVLPQVDYNNLLNKPNLSGVALSGNYSDLNGRPNIITAETQGLPDVLLLNNAANGRICELHTPIADNDAVNKHYVDSLFTSMSSIIDSLKRRIDSLETPSIDGTLTGLFSVSATSKVYFSSGNLQYQATSNTFRFAANQYDYLGSANATISSTNTNWIDLFGYGTSGWDNGATSYQPWSSSASSSNYLHNVNLTDSNANADWGVYNLITNGGNHANTWRTLTYSEWHYLFVGRTNASALHGLATVNGVHGLIILPDNWVTPNGYTFVSNSINGFLGNVYTAAQWSVLESHGAVFLPASGQRNGTTVTDQGSIGYYWSSSFFNVNDAHSFLVGSGNLGTGCCHYSCGCAVRLVRNY